MFRIPPVKTTVDDGSAGGWVVAFFGEPCFCGVTPVCDATESVFDRQLVNDLRIVVVDEPFLGLGMVRVLGIGDGWVKADGETIYRASDLKVALFKTDPASAA